MSAAPPGMAATMRIDLRLGELDQRQLATPRRTGSAGMGLERNLVTREARPTRPAKAASAARVGASEDGAHIDRGSPCRPLCTLDQGEWRAGSDPPRWKKLACRPIRFSLKQLRPDGEPVLVSVSPQGASIGARWHRHRLPGRAVPCDPACRWGLKAEHRAGR